jgi:hypothetical protein
LLHRLLLISVPVVLTAAAQQAEVTRYDVAQGLPQSLVNHVLQDHDGFIWLGTGDGLARFDGQHFRVYKHDPRDIASLLHNSIWGLAERDDGYLWVSTRIGMDLLDRRTGRFVRERTGPTIALDGCWRVLDASGKHALFYSPLSGDLLRLGHGRAERQHIPHLASYVSYYDPGTGVLTQLVGLDTLLTVAVDGSSSAVVLPNLVSYLGLIARHPVEHPSCRPVEGKRSVVHHPSGPQPDLPQHRRTGSSNPAA